MNATVVTTGAAIVLVVGLVAGWSLGRVQANGELRSLALAHQLETTALCANGLTLENTRRPDRLVMLLEERLDQSVRSASELVDEGARLYPVGTPYLKNAVRRAAEYYSTKNDIVKKTAAETLLARLNSE